MNAKKQRLCSYPGCDKRPGYVDRQGKRKADLDHDLCPKHWRALKNSHFSSVIISKTSSAG